MLRTGTGLQRAGGRNKALARQWAIWGRQYTYTQHPRRHPAAKTAVSSDQEAPGGGRDGELGVALQPGYHQRLTNTFPQPGYQRLDGWSALPDAFLQTPDTTLAGGRGTHHAKSFW